MARLQKLSLDSEVWKKAALLHAEQEHYRQEVKRTAFCSQQTPLSGLYADECHQHSTSADFDFASFVRCVRHVLSRSPRTLLRHMLNSSVNTKNGDAEWNQLVDLLLLSSASSSSSAAKRQNDTIRASASASASSSTMSLFDVGSCLDGPFLSKGKWHEKLQNARRCLSRSEDQALAEGWRRDEMAHEMVGGDAPRQKGGAERCLRSDRCHGAREERSKRFVARLSRAAEADPQRCTHQRIQELWNACRCRGGGGAKQIWERYKELDLALCRRRGQRGVTFEETARQICFASIVHKLIAKEQNQQRQQTQQRYTADVSRFSYDSNVFWWQNGRVIGEIDIVVLCDDSVVAICEMKSSCYELAGAFRQHRSKLGSEDVLIGPTRDCLYSRDASSNLELYVATLLPDNDSTTTPLLGAEPALANAICEGIRSQGCLVADGSIEYDPDYIWQASTTDALMYLDCFPKMRYCEDNSSRVDDLDYTELRRYVKEKMKPEQLQLSPAGCFEQNADQILVLPRSY